MDWVSLLDQTAVVVGCLSFSLLVVFFFAIANLMNLDDGFLKLFECFFDDSVNLLVYTSQQFITIDDFHLARLMKYILTAKVRY